MRKNFEITIDLNAAEYSKIKFRERRRGMLRIGDAAKRFNISNRTLRYREDEGILKSSRAENGYRFFDDENAMRIKQIVLLRKIKMPIADIEQVFISVA